MIRESIAAPCPHCARPYDASHRKSGDRVLCPGCPGWFLVTHRPGGPVLTACADPLRPAPALLDWPVITLTQPWASLVAIGAKRIESRGWPIRYRGPILIHAGASLGPVGGMRGLLEIIQRPVFAQALAAAGLDDRGKLPYGQLLARAEIYDCCAAPGYLAAGWRYDDGREWQLTEQERAFGNYAPGRWAWLLANVQPLERPIPARGYQRIWRWQGAL